MAYFTKLFLALAFMFILGLQSTVSAAGSVFQETWSQIKSDPYKQMPEYETTRSKFFAGAVNLLERAAKRTLSSEEDLLPQFQKLVHPTGICFAGTWTIDAKTPYTGYFAKGSKGQIIMRASEAMGNANVGDWRAFGLAGKIYPTSDAKDATSYKTANFFTVDDLGGTSARSFLDEPKLNEPKLSFHATSLLIFPTAMTIINTFKRADENPNIRQLYQISELGIDADARAVTPHWMMLRAENQERVGAKDFRNELRLKNYAQGLRFGIFVAEKGSDQWTRVGLIHLTEEALSNSCDHRLHFPHPRWR